MTTFKLVIASPKIYFLQHISCISYLVQFQERQTSKVQAIIGFDTKVNAKTSLFVTQLGLFIRLTSISIQKFDVFALKMYCMTIARFLI